MAEMAFARCGLRVRAAPVLAAGHRLGLAAGISS